MRCLFLSLLFSFGAATQAQAACDYKLFGYDPIQIQEFLDKLKTDSRAGNQSALSNRIHFPLRTNIDGSFVFIQNECDFLFHADHIFNSGVRSVIEEQSFDDLFCNYQGIMLGNGEVWIQLLNDRYGIITINN